MDPTSGLAYISDKLKTAEVELPGGIILPAFGRGYAKWEELYALFVTLDADLTLGAYEQRRLIIASFTNDDPLSLLVVTLFRDRQMRETLFPTAESAKEALEQFANRHRSTEAAVAEATKIADARMLAILGAGCEMMGKELKPLYAELQEQGQPTGLRQAYWMVWKWTRET